MSATLSEFIALIQAGDTERIRAVLDEPGGKDLLSRTFADGLYALHWAARARQRQVVELLLLQGADPNQGSEEEGNHRGYTAAHHASSNGDVDTLSVLASFKADFNCPSADKWTPLHVAAFKGNSPVVALLVNKGADVNCANSVGQTPILFAVNHGRLRDVRFFIKHKADIAYKDLHQDTLLHHALHYKMSEMFEGKYDVPESQLDIAVFLVLSGVSPAEKNCYDHKAYFYLKEKLPSLPVVLDTLYAERDSLAKSATELNYLTLVSATADHFIVLGLEDERARTLCEVLAKLDAERLAMRRGRASAVRKPTAKEAVAQESSVGTSPDAVRLPPGHAHISQEQLRGGEDPSGGKCPFFQKRGKVAAAPAPTPSIDPNRPLCPFSWAFVERHQTVFLASVASFILGMWADQLLDRILPRSR